MTANVALTDTFDQWRVKTNELIVGTQADGMANIIKTTDTTNSTSNTTGSIITAGGVGIAKSVHIGEDLKIWGDVTTVGDTTISGNLTFGDATTDQVTFTADINSHIIPNTDDTFDLGSSGQQWRNLYLNGTANLDVVDIDGAVQIDAAVTVGVNDTGQDVTFYGAAAGALMMWDQSEDALLVRGATADAAGSSGRIVLQTAQVAVADGDILGRVDFQAPLETQGSDGALVTASIWAEADDTFTATVNHTDLVFATGSDGAVTEKLRIDSTGQATFADGAIDVDIASHDGSNGLKLGGTLVTASAAELNIIDAGAAVTTPTVAGGDAFVMDDADVGIRQVDIDNVDTYLAATTKTLTNKTLTSPVLVTPALGTPASGVMTNVTGIVEAGLVDNAVTLAKMASGTDGNLITYDASGNPAYVVTGNDGQVLTSTGAGSPPVFETAAAAGITTGVAIAMAIVFG
jgi:hypothetical protein